MILAFSGNHFLAEEAARAALEARGMHLRDLPRLGGEEASALNLLPLLSPGLFGEAAALIDLEGVRPDKALLEALATPDALVVVIDPAGAPTRIKLYEEHGTHTSSPAPSRSADVAQWVTQRAKGLGLRLDTGAAQYLAEVFSDDLSGIIAELNKLQFLDGPFDRVAVQRVVGLEPPGDSFAMLGAATGGQVRQAQEQLSRLLGSGEDPFRILGAVVWQYSLIARAVALIAQSGRVTESQAAQQLGVKPYPAKKALEVARRLDEGRIRSHLQRILTADLAMKSGQDTHKVLQRLMVELSL